MSSVATQPAPTLSNQYNELASAVLKTEAQAILALIPRLGESFTRSCELILQCRGRVVVTGIGKSGHIGNKIASTMASTGTPAFFVHPAEASHGDMGMITAQDVLIAISNSGESPEVVSLLPVLKHLATPIIAMTGNAHSTLAMAATAHLDVSVEQEACPLNLAPTSSTTASLAMGDALAVALLQARGFTANDFALTHPGGALGRRLLLRVHQIMHSGDAIPKVAPDCQLVKALLEITQKRLGLTTVVNEHGELQGLFTDGDLRRALDKDINIHTTPIAQVMNPHCRTISSRALAAEALQVMRDHKITALVVTDDSQKLQGIVHMHDVLKAGLL